MSGAQPMSVTMNEGVIIDVEIDPERIKRKVKEGYCNKMTYSMDEAIKWMKEAVKKGEPLSIGLVGNAATVFPEFVKRNIVPDIVTDQTSAHNLLDYVPIGNLEELLKLKSTNPEKYKKLIT